MIQESIICSFCGLECVFQHQIEEPELRFQCPRCKRVNTVLRGEIVQPKQALLQDPYHVGVNIIES